jgi:hypothetical protein
MYVYDDIDALAHWRSHKKKRRLVLAANGPLYCWCGKHDARDSTPQILES